MTTNRHSALPPSWQTSSAAGEWWKRVFEAPHSVLILDYDGTLAPFALDRMEAMPFPGIDERLYSLLALSRVTLVLVTGRTWKEMSVLFPTSRLVEVWASHGWEHIMPGEQRKVFPLAVEQRRALLALIAAPALVKLPPAAVERKPASIAIHWRNLEADEKEQLRRRVLNTWKAHEPAGHIELLPFEDGLEIRATGRGKGDAVRAVRARFGADTPMAYLGDDQTDEEAFAAMDASDLALLVRPAPRATWADYWMPAPEGVLEFLDRWAEAADERTVAPKAESRASHGEDTETVNPSPS